MEAEHSIFYENSENLSHIIKWFLCASGESDILSCCILNKKDYLQVCQLFFFSIVLKYAQLYSNFDAHWYIYLLYIYI